MEAGTVQPTEPPPSVPSPISSTLATALARVVATVPPDKRGGLSLGLTLSGAQVEAAHTLATNWTVGTYGAYWWQSGAKEAGVLLKGSW